MSVSVYYIIVLFIYTSCRNTFSKSLVVIMTLKLNYLEILILCLPQQFLRCNATLFVNLVHPRFKI